ncbi:MAG: alpha/beta hydrolase [Burkholderiales bacterium]
MKGNPAEAAMNSVLETGAALSRWRARWLKAFAFVTIAFTLIYGAACGYMWMWQNHLIFQPNLTIDLTPEDYGLAFREVRLPVKNALGVYDEMHGWFIPAKGQKVLLYLHGNGGNIGSNLPHAVRFQRLGFSVFIVDYRGYGQSSGAHPTESQVYEDAHAAWNYLQAQGVDPKRIVIYGHSLGGAIAIDLAARVEEAAGLIVEGTFTSMRDAVVRGGKYWMFPVDFLLHQRFESLAKASSLNLPVLIIHGTADRKIPFDMGEKLIAAIPGTNKKLVLIPDGGHSNSAKVGRSLYLQSVESFAESVYSSRR